MRFASRSLGRHPEASAWLSPTDNEPTVTEAQANKAIKKLDKEIKNEIKKETVNVESQSTVEQKKEGPKKEAFKAATLKAEPKKDETKNQTLTKREKEEDIF